MRRSLLLSVLGLALLAGCGSSPSAPRAGDTLTPVLGTASRWKVGSSPEISARLQARGKDGKTRQLDFDGIATNPVVRVVFFEDATELGASQVTLSHRCWGGLYASPVGELQIPANATRAELTAWIDLPIPEVESTRVQKTVEIVKQ